MVVQACDGGWARKIASLKKKKRADRDLKIFLLYPNLYKKYFGTESS
jgi:hypothetical protein